METDGFDRKYKLAIVDAFGNPVCTIGTFDTEQDLIRWCEENDGAIKDS